MKAFVTGGTGFLGINLIKLLDEAGWHVTAICRPGADTSALADLPIDWRTGYITSKSDVDACLDEDVDVVFHLAGDTNLWSPNNDKQFEVNVTATQYLVDVSIKKAIPKFIHTSSISAFGFHSEVINETTPSTALQSGVNYLKTKYLGEQVVKKAVIEKGLDAVILNPCAIMGPYDKHNWSQLFSLIKNDDLPGVPNGEGSYCHVKEVAKAHLSAVTQGAAGENYILAGVDHTFLEVVNKIAKLLDVPEKTQTMPDSLIALVGRVSHWLSLLTRREPNMTPEKAKMVTKRVVASSEKAKSQLGYNNEVLLDDMLKDCFDWLKSEGRI